MKPAVEPGIREDHVRNRIREAFRPRPPILGGSSQSDSAWKRKGSD